MLADLHVHTTESDGQWLPEQVGQEALVRGISMVAITDHDTTNGIERAKLGAPSQIRIIPGIEISTEQAGKDVHILGYWIDITNRNLQTTLTNMREARHGRIGEMISKLNNIGIDLDIDAVYAHSQEDVISRSHIAAELQRRGLIEKKSEAFDRWIGIGGPAFVPRLKISPIEAIEIIRHAGGLPVLAHPGLIKCDHLIEELAKHGLQGLEVVHSTHTPRQTAYYQELAKRLDLLPSGGSDCHGPGGKDEMYLGRFSIPDSWVHNMENRLETL